jgi:hypothetical protein
MDAMFKELLVVGEGIRLELCPGHVRFPRGQGLFHTTIDTASFRIRLGKGYEGTAEQNA